VVHYAQQIRPWRRRASHRTLSDRMKDDSMTDTEINKDVLADQVETEEPPQEAAPQDSTETGDTGETDAFFNTAVSMPGAPEASADGAWLAFLKPDDFGALELWIAPTDRGEPREIPVPFIPIEDVNPETGRIVRGPQWSPDGSQLALTGLRPEGDHTAVWLVPTGISETREAAAAADMSGVMSASEDASVSKTTTGEASEDDNPVAETPSDETPADELDSAPVAATAEPSEDTP